MKNILTLLLTVLVNMVAFAQYQISGVVKDAETGETLIGANVLYGENLGVVTDFDGNY